VSSYDVLVSSAIKAPKFLHETRYVAPNEPTDGLVQYANQTKFNTFEYLQSIPSLFQDFNLFMGNTMGAREYWHDWYDVHGRLLTGFEPSQGSALLVDIGGGKGHDLMAFDAAFGMDGKTYDGQLILQDLPQVLDKVADDQLNSKVKKLPHNFFEEQPVKGEPDTCRCSSSALTTAQVRGVTSSIISCTTGRTNTVISS
jgi:hypothetical protein